ncbi:MAG: serine/threonine protein kinase, partial [Thermodesulfobacteriota bacterium]
MIPGYSISKEIYRSVKKIVYRGSRVKDGIPVIFKTFLSEFPSPKDIAGLKREYEIISGLKVKGIPAVYSLEKNGSSFALIIEDIGGITLHTLIESGEIDLFESLEIGIKLCETLGEIHRQNIIHKDINPQNIIINPKTKTVNLIDFSISSLLPIENPKINHPALLEGTLPYISPEQTGRMNRSLDHRTDFYSLGITFYEMFTAQLPFSSIDPLELVHCHIAKIPKTPSEINPEIPMAVSEIVMKLL